MGANINYYYFSTQENWLKGDSTGIKFVDNCLQVDNQAVNNNVYRAIYLSSSLDSFEKSTVWHRLLIDGTIPANANIYLSYFASDHDTISYQGQEISLDDLICNRQIKLAEKEKVLKNFWVDQVVDPKDFLLHKARGRYLWFKLELVSYSCETPIINNIKIEFPLQTLVNYLPEIYQQDQQSFDLLNRFLGIFQSLMVDLDVEIAKIASCFDPDIVEKEFLHWLSGWLAIEDFYIWPENKLKYLIKNAYRLYKIKGTKQSIEEIVKLYTDQKPMIVESFAIEEFSQDYQVATLLKNLYGDNRYTFTVIVDESSISTTQKYLELKQIIERFKPAHTILKLVVLKPYLFLDNFTYLGINSKLSGSKELILDGRATIPFDTTLQMTGVFGNEE